jgi:hypothetical protein
VVFRFEISNGKFAEEKQGWAGKAKIRVRYSMNPVYRIGKPQLKYSKEVEKEFSIVK